MNKQNHESYSGYFPPGEYLGDIMLDDYARKLGISIDECGDLLAGDLAVDCDLAKKLEKLTDISADTWLNLQRSYDQRRNKAKEMEQMTKCDKMKDLTNEMLKIYMEKNADYGDSFSKSYKEFGIIAPVVRMSDKMERIKQLSKAEDIKVKDESLKDTLIDIANYAIMTAIEMDLEEEEEDRAVTLGESKIFYDQIRSYKV